MKIVGAALGDYVEHAASGASDFSRIPVGRHLIFLNGVLTESVRAAASSGAAHRLAEERIVGIRSIHLEAIRSAALAAEGKIARPRGVVHHARRGQSDV